MRDGAIITVIRGLEKKIDGMKGHRAQIDQEVITLRLQMNAIVRILRWIFPLNLIFKKLVNKEYDAYKSTLEKRKAEVEKMKSDMSKEKLPAKVDEKEKIGRNAKCHCGSGKKYKNCCLSKKDDIKVPSEAEIKEIKKNSKIVE